MRKNEIGAGEKEEVLYRVNRALRGLEDPSSSENKLFEAIRTPKYGWDDRPVHIEISISICWAVEEAGLDEIEEKTGEIVISRGREHSAEEPLEFRFRWQDVDKAIQQNDAGKWVFCWP